MLYFCLLILIGAFGHWLNCVLFLNYNLEDISLTICKIYNNQIVCENYYILLHEKKPNSRFSLKNIDCFCSLKKMSPFIFVRACLLFKRITSDKKHRLQQVAGDDFNFDWEFSWNFHLNQNRYTFPTLQKIILHSRNLRSLGFPKFSLNWRKCHWT